MAKYGPRRRNTIQLSGTASSPPRTMASTTETSGCSGPTNIHAGKLSASVMVLPRPVMGSICVQSCPIDLSALREKCRKA